MYALKLVIVPTGALTFRRAPFATLHMATYQFLPPTTLSGFLRRLMMLANGLEPPLTGDHARDDLNRFFVLPPEYVTLGAYPWPPGAATVHRTRRQGIRSFDHTAFSRLVRQPGEENYQLYTWEYFLAQRLVGYVVSETQEPLVQLRQVQGWGSKIGKEGYAFVEEVNGPLALEVRRTSALPLTVVPAQAVIGQPSRIFPLYRYAWQELYYPPADSAAGAPGNSIKFELFQAAQLDAPVELDYYTNGQEFIPAALVEALRGGR